MEEDMDDPFSAEEPDLDEYFDQFGLTDQERIGMCRTYANYLAQKVRTRLPRTPKAPKAKKIKGDQ